MSLCEDLTIRKYARKANVSAKAIFLKYDESLNYCS